MYETLRYWCMRPSATGVWGLKLLVYEAFSYWCKAKLSRRAHRKRVRDVCWRMLMYADVCWRMLTYAGVCWRMLAYAGVCWRMRRISSVREPIENAFLGMAKPHAYRHYTIYTLEWERFSHASTTELVGIIAKLVSYTYTDTCIQNTCVRIGR